MFDRLGRVTLRARWVLLAGWLLAAAFFGLAAPSLTSVASADETSFLPANSASLAARRVIAAAFPGDSSPSQALLVFSRPDGLTEADHAAIEGLRSWFEGAGHPAPILRYVTAEGSPQLATMLRSGDGVVELARVDLSTPAFIPSTNAAIDAIRAHLASAGLPPGLQVQLTGQAGIGRDYLAAIQEGTNRTTLVTIVLVVVVLLVIYRAPLAALVPLMTIGAAFFVSRGVLGFMGQGGWKLASVLDSFIVVLAFGVGTDYTIFLISRFREQLGHQPRDEAIRSTVSRIGAVITASAATVVVGLCSMAVAQFGMIQSTGPALAIVIVITLLAGLTLTPSLLTIFGHRLFWPFASREILVSSNGNGSNAKPGPDPTAADSGSTASGSADPIASADSGVWASLARLITARPALVAGLVMILLAAPLLALPAVKQNFDVLSELPSGAESRTGFETLSAHLAKGQLMPLTVVVSVPDGDLSTDASLRAVYELEQKMAAVPDVQTVRSVVDPNGTGQIATMVQPAAQLQVAVLGFAVPPSSDLNVRLGSASLAALQSVSSYLESLGAAYPAVAGSTSYTSATADLVALQAQLLAARSSADVSGQLASMADQLQAGAGTGEPTDVAQLQTLSAYFTELGAALPEVKSQAAYRAVVAALTALAADPSDATAGAGLVASIRELAAWFDSRSTPFYFVPSSVASSPQAVAQAQAAAETRARLVTELGAVASAFGPDELYAPPALLSAYESADRNVVRLYVTTTTDPYDQRSFEVVWQLRSLLATQAASLGTGAQAYLGGATAEFSDVQKTIGEDFNRVALITIAGILIVLVVLLRALVAPVYLVATVLLSFASSLSLSALILQSGFGEAGINYFIPMMVFVLLVALGSDYNIFLMSRVREESATRPLRKGIRVASAHTGTVITSAGLILAGTFTALVTSPLMLLFQVGVVVALGVLIDTFVVRSLLVPAITATLDRWAWWPSRHRAGGGGGTAEA